MFGHHFDDSLKLQFVCLFTLEYDEQLRPRFAKYSRRTWDKLVFVFHFFLHNFCRVDVCATADDYCKQVSGSDRYCILVPGTLNLNVFQCLCTAAVQCGSKVPAKYHNESWAKPKPSAKVPSAAVCQRLCTERSCGASAWGAVRDQEGAGNFQISHQLCLSPTANFISLSRSIVF